MFCLIGHVHGQEVQARVEQLPGLHEAPARARRALSHEHRWGSFLLIIRCGRFLPVSCPPSHKLSPICLVLITKHATLFHHNRSPSRHYLCTRRRAEPPLYHRRALLPALLVDAGGGLRRGEPRGGEGRGRTGAQSREAARNPREVGNTCDYTLYILGFVFHSGVLYMVVGNVNIFFY